MAPNEDQRYDPAPPIPTYDEAIAGGSAWHDLQHDDHAHSPIDRDAAEGQSLLTSSSRHAFESSSNTPNTNRNHRTRGAYRPPTVETDDESNMFSSSDSDSDSDDEREAAHVRREMQELEIDDSGVGGGVRSLRWGKRIGRALSLPQWRGWKWRWRIPGLTRRRTVVADGGEAGTAGAGDAATPRSRWALPKLGSAALFLLVGRMLAVMIVLGVLYLLFASDLFTNMARRMGSQMFDPESVRIHVQSSVDPRRIGEHLQHYSEYPHLAGTEGDFALMEDTEMLFKRYGLEDVQRDVYHVYLNYPKADGGVVEILGADGKATWSAKLEDLGAGGWKDDQPTHAFHGLSKSGDVQGPLIYANYGSREDFESLRKLGIDTKGAIALVRDYGTQIDRGLKVKAAELAGFVGCLIFTDPRDESKSTGRGISPAARNGSVSLKNWVVGDVLTPGWGSKENLPRMKVGQTKGLVKIPSLPLSWPNAEILLKHLEGVGHVFPPELSSAEGGGLWTGSSTGPVVRLKNEQDEIEKQPIWNVHGRIYGVEQEEKKVIIGSHRDSWVFGVLDPPSGTAVMLEVIRVFGDLLARGWRPLRTIEFASWDAAEYNLIGSTEYVEQNEDALREDALAYINLGAAVTGGEFHAAGSPVFRRLLLQVMNRVSDITFNATLRNLWDERQGDIEGLGIDSDYVAFQDIVGASSLDLHFDAPGLPPYSSQEDMEWSEQLNDPGYLHHVLLAQVVGLMILELADRPVMPFDMLAYADKLLHWVQDLAAWMKQQGMDGKVSLKDLEDAAHTVGDTVARFAKWELYWENKVLSGSGWESSILGRERCEYNSRMARFESDLLDPAGIPDRKQFKHVLFGPQPWSSSDDAYFPSIRDAVTSGNATFAQETVNKVAETIKNAASHLVA
ncbi:hypothetical protein N0V88_006853 [Collariella sp. IMI 366227]|nr:hypothetical protein N0V88_006853 [Collariella sp. IMI 366227]